MLCFPKMPSLVLIAMGYATLLDILETAIQQTMEIDF